MKIFTKYALAAALIIPSIFTFTAKNAEAASAVKNSNAAAGVNVRSEAKLGDNIIGLIDDDSQYQIIEQKDGWFKIDFEGKEAYVSSDLFHLLEESEVVSATNFRKEDNISSEVIKVLEKGTKLETIDIGENGFVKVKVDGEIGYVYHNLIKTFRDRADVYEKAQPANKQVAKQNTEQVANNQVASQQAPSQEYQASTNWAKEWIAQRESGGSYTAYNPRGGYYGRYQLNPSLVPYGASPAQQEAAADNYVAQRYGSWENAQAFWQRNGWY